MPTVRHRVTSRYHLSTKPPRSQRGLRVRQSLGVGMPGRYVADVNQGVFISTHGGKQSGANANRHSTAARLSPDLDAIRSAWYSAHSSRTDNALSRTVGQADRVLQGVSPWSTGYGNGNALAFPFTYPSCLPTLHFLS